MLVGGYSWERVISPLIFNTRAMRIICFGLLSILGVACTSPNYTLSGKLPETSIGKEVLLLTRDGRGADTLARRVVTEDRSFEIKGEETGRVLYLKIGERGQAIPFYPESGEYYWEQRGEYEYIFSKNPGTGQVRLAEHLLKLDSNMQQIQLLQQKYRDVKNEEDTQLVMGENELLWRKGNDLLVDAVKEFEGTNIAVMLVRENMWKIEQEFKVFKRVVEAMGTVPESEDKEEIMNKYKELESKQLTGQAPDFKLPDVKGNIVALSDYKGKYLLVDFWASWCAPCRAKAKVLKKEYPRLQELGVEVVGISCDKKKDQWLKAIEEDKPLWRQLLVDKEINGSDTSDDYKVEFIPTLYLISPDGMILEKNPSLEEIEMLVENKVY